MSTKKDLPDFPFTGEPFEVPSQTEVSLPSEPSVNLPFIPSRKGSENQSLSVSLPSKYRKMIEKNYPKKGDLSKLVKWCIDTSFAASGSEISDNGDIVVLKQAEIPFGDGLGPA